MVNGHILGETSDVCVLDSRIVKIVEVIEDGDYVPGREQLFNEMGPDETRPASDQNSHGARSSTTKHKKCTKKIMIAWHCRASVSAPNAFGAAGNALQFKNCASASADKSSLTPAPRRPRRAHMFSPF